MNRPHLFFTSAGFRALLLVLLLAPNLPASADVIDDFTHALPLGGYRADIVTGVGGGTQTGITPSRVIGGFRETTITATLPALPLRRDTRRRGRHPSADRSNGRGRVA